MTTVNIYEMEQTWNNGATTFTAIEMNVTDTASASASLLMDLQVGGTSRAKFAKTGVLTVNTADLADSATLFDFQENGVSKFLGTVRDGFTFSMGSSRAVRITQDGLNRVQIGNSGGIGYVTLGNGTLEWNPNTAISGSNDLVLRRDGPGILAQYNGVNAQTSRVYSSYTDASNNEGMELVAQAGDALLRTFANGTGTRRNIVLDGANRGAHIADVPTAGSATAADNATAINAILVALENHGLVATS